jgi:hypothetical protein
MQRQQSQMMQQQMQQQSGVPAQLGMPGPGSPGFGGPQQGPGMNLMSPANSPGVSGPAGGMNQAPGSPFGSGQLPISGGALGGSGQQGLGSQPSNGGVVPLNQSGGQPNSGGQGTNNQPGVFINKSPLPAIVPGNPGTPGPQIVNLSPATAGSFLINSPFK